MSTTPCWSSPALPRVTFGWKVDWIGGKIIRCSHAIACQLLLRPAFRCCFFYLLGRRRGSLAGYHRNRNHCLRPELSNICRNATFVGRGGDRHESDAEG